MSIDGRLASRTNRLQESELSRSKFGIVNQALEPSRPQGRHARKRSDHDVFIQNNEGLINNNDL